MAGRMTEVRQRSQRSQASRGLGAVGTEDASAVARQIDAARRAATIAVDARQPLTAHRLEVELAACKIGQLRFGPQMPSHADRIAFEAVLAARRVAHAR